MSLSPLVLDEREQRLRAALVTVLLCILSHFLCYYPVQEYHYTTLLPTLPRSALALAAGKRALVSPAADGVLRGFLAGLYADALLPGPEGAGSLCRPSACCERVVPVAVAFLCLTAYGLASVWLRRATRTDYPSDDRSHVAGGPAGRDARRSCWAACWGRRMRPRRAAVEYAFARGPLRISRTITTGSSPSFSVRWRPAPSFAAPHNNLGVALVKARPLRGGDSSFRAGAGDRARQRRSAGAISAESPGRSGPVQRGDCPVPKGVGERAEQRAGPVSSSGQRPGRRGPTRRGDPQYRKVLTIDPDAADADTSLAIVLAGCGRYAEAVSHFRQAAELQPDGLDCQRNWPGCGRLARSPRSATAPERSNMPSMPTSSARESGRTCWTPWRRPMPKQGGSRTPCAPRGRPWSWPDNKTTRHWPHPCPRSLALYEAGKPFHESPPRPAEPKKK